MDMLRKAMSGQGEEGVHIKQVLKDCERVKIRLPFLENREDDCVEVGINGEMYVIKRGETVEIPVMLVEVLQHAELI